MTTVCWFCSTEMVWESDNSLDVFDIDADGIVTSLSCPNCFAYAKFIKEKQYYPLADNDCKIEIVEVHGEI